MYGRRRMPVAKTVLAVGVTKSIARNEVQKQQMAVDNARTNEYYRQLEADRQIQMQAAATEDAVRRGVLAAEGQKQVTGQYSDTAQQSGGVQPGIACSRCKQFNQLSNSFCTNCGLKLTPP
jgi:hypothetical protein